jgi:hypothetical protein
MRQMLIEEQGSRTPQIRRPAFKKLSRSAGLIQNLGRQTRRALRF